MPRRIYLAAALALAAACRGEREERALAEIERLAFVPVAECVFPALAGPPLVCSNSAPLLVDRYEVRRLDWKRWYAAQTGRDPLHAAELARWDSTTDDLPAAFMNQDEARRFAAARGMRLLTAREWLRVTAGDRLQVWPWGQNREGVANTLELGLARTVAVGTFEQGKNPLGIYDLAGNVWEWVDLPILRPYTGGEPGQEWAMGGSYLSRKRRLWEIVTRWWFHAQELDPRARSIEVGLRCASDAGVYLWDHGPSWGASAGARERLIALGAGWGREASPLLEELCARDGAAPGLFWLLEGTRR